ncbi:MAG: thermonuclease family protein [Boseongicola sp.]|nr:thermonuclease family protein [Boseongicola sp.]
MRAALGDALAAAVGRLWRRKPRVLKGEAAVTDGDGLLVQGHAVRFAALDAPEFDQLAKVDEDGAWINHGLKVKDALTEEVGGRHVRVAVESWDRHGRAVGTVTLDGRDIGEWLVREGHAVAAYGDRYKDAERDAKEACRGMWGYARAFDPRWWRHRKAARK